MAQSAKQILSRRQAAFATKDVHGNQAGSSGDLLAPGRARRTRNVTVFVDEIKIIVVALHRMLDQGPGFPFACLRLGAHVTGSINKVKILLILPLQVQAIHLFCHGSPPGELDSPACLGVRWKKKPFGTPALSTWHLARSTLI